MSIDIDPEVQRYLALDVYLLAARWRNDNETEDAVLGEMDALWWSWTEERRHQVEHLMSDCLRWGAECVAAWPKESK